MKVCAIIGSPRKRNTYKFVKLFEEMVNKYEKAEFDYLFLRDYEISQCRGCMSCVKNGEKTCPNYGPVNEIKERMMNADALVLSTPVFCSGITGLLKTLIDHFIFVVHRTCFMEKYAFTIATTQYSGLKDTLKYMKGQVKRWAYYFTGEFGVQSSVFISDKKYQTKKMDELDKKAKIFVDYIKTKRVPPLTFEDILYFRIWQRYMSLSYQYERLGTLDTEYWREQGLLDRNYFTDIKTSPLKDFLARRIADRAEKDMHESLSFLEEMEKKN